MDLIKSLANEEVVVLGAGLSGLAATRLLLSYGSRVVLADDAPREKLRYFALFKERDHKALRQAFNNTERVLSPACRALILSPGISFAHPLVKAAKARALPIINEIDLALPLLKGALLVGITGTNGKSTTTVMLENILRCAGFKVWAGGNLGQPLCALVADHPQERFDYIILELSSYQLEALTTLKLERALLLNITPDHLDRYTSMASYVTAKLRIANLVQPHGALCINEELLPLLASSVHVHTFNRTNFNSSFPGLELRGDHNQENAIAAATCARSLGIAESAIREGLVSFKPLPHRCEHIACKAGITFINDSKGTTIDAVKMALSLTTGPVQLLLGGLAKGEDFSALNKAHFPSIEGYHVFGHAQQKILSELKSASSYAYENLDQAFKGALNKAQAGHTILLSPGCASFDQFTDFNARGEHFRRLVNSLEEV